MSAILRLYNTTVGQKLLMALTGLGLVGFIIAHLSGNFLMFRGAEAMNAYAKLLKDQGPLLWGARIGLLAMFGFHIHIALRLRKRNSDARKQAYAFEETLQATWMSRNMLLTGLLVLGFIAFHLAHFTLGFVDPTASALKTDSGQHDVFGMVVQGFKNPLYTMLYVACMGIVAVHLAHGVSSLFQTLGLHHKAYFKYMKFVGPAFAALIFVGFCSIPAAVIVGIIKEST